MADDPNEGVPQQKEISILNEFVSTLIHGMDEGESIHISKTQADGTMRSWSLHVGMDPDGVERVMRVDEDGVFVHVPIVTDEDGNKLPISGTEDGVLKIDISGAVKSQEVALLNHILAELRLHTFHWQEMMESGFRLEDLGEHEPKASA